ncbi:uncharacterized protein LOC121752958 isoform X2 [Salvia splendens]|uniref:uncharacterized protein LOC121752958 isoform X2 n=1 Tax=Salvia splendens TaxID=180675 RepID=UPI001C2804E3|nr:uncharacterized protein LOC121752958 isoform X2 [Salvia splendens]
MAVTQESDCNSKTPLKESIQHCGGEVADPQHSKYDGPSTRRKAIRKNVCGHQGGSRIKNRKSDKLHDIDDTEIVGYLNTKEEMHCKRILWEAMNEKCIKAKKQKIPAETKKSGAVKIATKTTEKVEPKKHSSRINYDALKSLGGDFERCESGESSKAESPKQSKESWYEDDRSDDETFGGDEEEDESQYQYQDEDLFDDFDT